MELNLSEEPLVEKVYYQISKLCLLANKFTDLQRAKGAYHLYIMTKRKPTTLPKLKPSGAHNSVAFVGINPSHTSRLKDIWEDQYGELLAGLFTEAGIKKDRVWVTNLWKSPTDNNRELTPEEVGAGKLELSFEMMVVQPTLIVAMGNQVMKALEAKRGEITKWRGYNVIGCPHPSMLHRVPSGRKDIVDVFKIAKQYVRFVIQ